MRAWSPACCRQRGDYQLLDDFTERVDTDISNNAGMLGVPGPPRTFGLYRDGNRIAALPKPGPLDVGYAPASLDALPYQLIPHANVLLAGASGGFRIAEVLALGAAHVQLLEPEPVLLRALQDGLGPSPGRGGDGRVTLSGEGPVAAVRDGGSYDIIDLSADFLDAAEANVTAFTVQAIAADLRALAPGGIVSIPVSIRDFPVYALRVLATARAALLAAGIGDPAAHTVVYRSAWSARILLSNRAVGCRADRRAAQVLRRSFVRRVVVSGHGSGRRARQHLQRPAGGVVRQRRGHLGGPGRFDRRRGAPRCWPMRRRHRASPSTWRRSRSTGRSSMPCCGSISSARS